MFYGAGCVEFHILLDRMKCYIGRIHPKKLNSCFRVFGLRQFLIEFVWSISVEIPTWNLDV